MNERAVLARMLFEAAEGDDNALLTAADLLIHDLAHVKEAEVYHESLKKAATGERRQPNYVYQLEIVKKFGNPADRKLASKLLRQYHRTVKHRKLHFHAQFVLSHKWSEAMK